MAWTSKPRETSPNRPTPRKANRTMLLDPDDWDGRMRGADGGDCLLDFCPR